MALNSLDLTRGLTLKDAASKLHKSVHWLRQNRIRLEIPHVKIGGTYFFDQAELEHWVNQQRVGGSASAKNLPSRPKVKQIRL